MVDVSQNFWKMVDIFFPKVGHFFKIFEMYLPTTPQKSFFIAFLLTNIFRNKKKLKILKLYCQNLGFSWRKFDIFLKLKKKTQEKTSNLKDKTQKLGISLTPSCRNNGQKTSLRYMLLNLVKGDRRNRLPVRSFSPCETARRILR